MQNQNLKAIEKKVWQLNFQDGITDITIALVLIVSTICQIFNKFRFYLYLLFIIPVLFSIFARKYITVPRMGLVKYSKERNQKRHLLTFSISAIIFIILASTITGTINKLQPVTPIFIGAIILIICSIIAFVLNYARMYFYGILIALSELTIYKTGLISDGAFAWLITGIIILLIGIIYLVRFIKEYPNSINGDQYGE